MKRAILTVFRWLLRLVYRVEVAGVCRHEGRTLIIANHESFLDGLLLAAFLPMKPVFLVNTAIARKWYFRLPLKAVRTEVADTTKPMAIKRLVALVESGEPVAIFPEGHITLTGSLMKIYDGPAFVAVRTGCDVIPVHIDGTLHTPFSRVWGRHGARAWFPRLRMTIYPAVKLTVPQLPRARERRRFASERMRRIMQETAYLSRRRRSIWQALVEAALLHGRGRKVLGDVTGNFEPISYGAILKGSLALGRLASRLTHDGEMVGVLMPNVNATVCLMFGLAAVNRVAAMLNYTAGATGVRAACRAANARLVITSRAFIEKARLAGLVAGLAGIEVVYLEDLRRSLTLRDKLWLVFWGLRRPARAAPPAAPSSPALTLFTSGSEGAPKGVVLSHDCLLANVAQINAAFPFSSSDKFMSTLPLFHAFGVTGGILAPLLKGCQVMLYPSPLHYRAVPEFVYDNECTILFSTNTFLGKYAKVAHPYDFRTLRRLVVGAEKLTDDVRRLCMDKFGLRVLEAYGATECSPGIAISSPLAYRPGAVGELLPGMEYRLTPVDGIEEGGLLHLRGDNVMLGYLRPDRPGEIQPAQSELGPGWYNTGDVASVSGEYVTIHSRLKRFAKVAGEMVALELVERIAGEAQPNAVHAAIAADDAERGEAIVLFSEDAGLDRERMKAAARLLGAPEIAAPRRIVHIGKIPLLGNGKKDYAALAKLAREAPPAGERSVAQ